MRNRKFRASKAPTFHILTIGSNYENVILLSVIVLTKKFRYNMKEKNTLGALDRIKKFIRINNTTLVRAESIIQFYVKNPYLKLLIFIFPIILFSIFLGVKVVFPFTYTRIIQEDSPIEYLQAFFYFLSSILSLIVSFTFFKNKFFLHGVLYSLLAFGLFLLQWKK